MNSDCCAFNMELRTVTPLQSVNIATTYKVSIKYRQRWQYLKTLRNFKDFKDFKDFKYFKDFKDLNIPKIFNILPKFYRSWRYTRLVRELPYEVSY